MLTNDKMLKGVRIGPMKYNQGIRIGLIPKEKISHINLGIFLGTIG
jgi:hypothetical protein